MSNNGIYLLEKLQQLAAGKGFIVAALDGYYVQFSDEHLPGELYFEAVSHHFIDTVPETLGSRFAALGFKIDDGNYYKNISKNRLEAVVAEVEKIFTDLYLTDYSRPIVITDEIER